MNCLRCHKCGKLIRIVLDGEEWCDSCQSYQRPLTHGWAVGEDTTCPNTSRPLARLLGATSDLPI